MQSPFSYTPTLWRIELFDRDKLSPLKSLAFTQDITIGGGEGENIPQF